MTEKTTKQKLARTRLELSQGDPFGLAQDPEALKDLIAQGEEHGDEELVAIAQTLLDKLYEHAWMD